MKASARGWNFQPDASQPCRGLVTVDYLSSSPSTEIFESRSTWFISSIPMHRFRKESEDNSRNACRRYHHSLRILWFSPFNLLSFRHMHKIRQRSCGLLRTRPRTRHHLPGTREIRFAKSSHRNRRHGVAVGGNLHVDMNAMALSRGIARNLRDSKYLRSPHSSLLNRMSRLKHSCRIPMCVMFARPPARSFSFTWSIYGLV